MLPGISVEKKTNGVLGEKRRQGEVMLGHREAANERKWPAARASKGEKISPFKTR